MSYANRDQGWTEDDDPVVVVDNDSLGWTIDTEELAANDEPEAEAAAAQTKRWQRKKRRRELEERLVLTLQQKAGHPPPLPPEKVHGCSGTGSPPSLLQRQSGDESERPTQPPPPPPPLREKVADQRPSEENEKTNDPQQPQEVETEDGDEFDMFSSSVSPPRERTTTQAAAAEGTTPNSINQRGHEQQDWDDAEGYYKAVIGEIIHLDHHPASTTTTASPPPQQQQPHTDGSTSGGGGGGGSGSSSPDDVATIRVRVAGVIGKGVFSTVYKCTTVSNSSSVPLPPVTAIKCIRHNDSMTKAALTTELTALLRLRGCRGIVPLLLPTQQQQQQQPPLEHRGHVILVFAHMEYNLRDVLQKFGKGVGLSLQAVRSYFGQLLAAATHLQKHNIIHADLKPDNILVSADFATIQIADFGSAMDVSLTTTNASSGNSSSVCSKHPPTPYLVSRFYRAPEIILGMPPTYAIDLWSLAVTVAELFLGEVLFRGTSNNDMLYVFMQHLGRFSNRIIRQHLVLSQRYLMPPQFQQKDGNYCFIQQTTDAVTGSPVHKVLSLVTVVSSTSNNFTNHASMTAAGTLPSKKIAVFPLGTPLHQRLIKAKSTKDARTLVQQFSNLLQHCLALDPTRRIALKDALRHDFFQTTTTTATASNTLPIAS